MRLLHRPSGERFNFRFEGLALGYAISAAKLELMAIAQGCSVNLAKTMSPHGMAKLVTAYSKLNLETAKND